MVRAFDKSRKITYLIGLPLSLVAVAAGWFILGNYTGTTPIRLISSILTGVVVWSLVMMICRVIAAGEYQRQLLPFYENLDPESMLSNLAEIDMKKLSEGERIMLSVHKANGYLYLGRTKEAITLLSSISVNDKDLNNRYLVAGALASGYLMDENWNVFDENLRTLSLISADKKCSKELSLRARRIIAYLQLCASIKKGKRCNAESLKKDFASSRVPVHKLDVAYYIVLNGSHRPGEDVSEYIKYIKTDGKKTVYPSLIENL